MEHDRYLPHTSVYQQQEEELSSVLHELMGQASRYCINLNGCVRRNLGVSALRGSRAVIYQGTMIPDGTKVAIKTLYCALPYVEVHSKRILREVHIWSKLRHENIVPLLGISTEFDSTVSIISEWMPMGTAHDYVQNAEHDPRPLLEDIATGLHYLHSHELGPVVHGDLKGLNVLVSRDCRALLIDFGLATLDTSTFGMTVDAFRGGSHRWMAPELLDDCPASRASDVWAFGMTALELFTRDVPFPDCHSSPGVLVRLIHGMLPPRPAEESTQFRMINAWWEICVSCWSHDPSCRPTMKDIIEEIKAVIYPTGATSLPRRPLPVEENPYSPDTPHQQEAMLHKLLDRASSYCILLDGRIRGKLENPLCGSTAAVYQGTLAPSGTKVAIKVFHHTRSSTEAELKRIFREVHLWSKLRHKNVVPILGISTKLGSPLSIISEWMPLGNAHTYVRNTQNDPRPLVKGIASGLHYLHSHELGPIVHGDLKGLNVLVSSDRRALLTDFGLSTLSVSTFKMTVDTIHGGSLRWMAPELLDDGGPSSMASDVWALGMTALELFTRAIPFPDCRNPTRRITDGKLPPRPVEESAQFPLTDGWWEICTSCWERDPSLRPKMKDILEKIKAAIQSQEDPALMCHGASGSASPISQEGGNHSIPEDPEVAGRNTATGQASESSTLMKTAPEYPKSTADTSKSPFSTEFFTCLVAQPSPMSDLNDESPPPPLTTIDESGSVDLERSSVEDDPLPSGSSNTSRPIGFPSHFESLMSQSGSALEDISRGADILEANAKDIKIA
ncbi:kinase-like domain-containing protein [Pisolithus thermaeus]|nr:kinase-like domain-containing protein [Pisolithus thermaeus]